MVKKTAKKRHITKKLTPEERKVRLALLKQKKIEAKYRADVKAIFTNAGFQSFKVESKEFQFLGRTGELDSLFLYENVVIVCEDTYARRPSEHLLKKKVLFDLINSNKSSFIDFLIEHFPEFKAAHEESYGYAPHQYEVRVIYTSRYSIPDEHVKLCSNVFFFNYSRFRYFSALGKIVGKSSRFELFKFFGLHFSDIGEFKVRGGLSRQSGTQYEGFLLPEANSQYPTGYKVLSFYVDPETLLQKSYVLRKDSWEDPDTAYQRMLVPKKIRAMRKYLHDSKRVYVNNLVVTLPGNTKVVSLTTDQELSPTQLLDKQPVKIALPEEFNSIGLIDGQHRVYSYHEGYDQYESTISRLRTHQNLLVTAIMYPEHISNIEKTKFESNLFLEINSEQSKASSELIQAIALIVRPFTTEAISKAIISRIAKNGPLAGLLVEHYFDEEYKIKTSSIVSYGLKPLVKFKGNDSLVKLWGNSSKAKIQEQVDKELLDEYITFCVGQINELFLGFKLNLNREQWNIENKQECILGPTSINGFIVCLRELVLHGMTGDSNYYAEKLKNVSEFPFSSYKSSHWKKLGLELFKVYFHYSDELIPIPDGNRLNKF